MGVNWDRRTLLRAGGAVGALSLAGCTGLGGLLGGSTDGWGMFQRGPKHTGAASASGPGESLSSAWTVQADKLASGRIEDAAVVRVSTPAVVGGTVYATLSNVRESGGLYLVALDAKSGETKWSAPVTDRYGLAEDLPAPVVAGGTAYVTLKPIQGGPSVVAIDAGSGDVRWRAEGDRAPYTQATVHGGSVVVGGKTAFALGTDGTGDWQFEATGDGSIATIANPGWPPAVTDERVYVPTAESVHALDRSGSQQWTRTLAFEDAVTKAQATPKTPVVGDKSVYAVASVLDQVGQGRLYALDPASGDTRWTYQPAFDAERRRSLVYTMQPDREGPPPLHVGIYGPPALADGTLYALGYAMPEERAAESVPHLYALDAKSGDRQWATELPGGFGYTPPVVAGGTVYVATEAGLVAVDADGGAVRATADQPYLFGGLAVSGTSLFGSDASTLYAFGSP